MLFFGCGPPTLLWPAAPCGVTGFPRAHGPHGPLASPIALLTRRERENKKINMSPLVLLCASSPLPCLILVQVDTAAVTHVRMLALSVARRCRPVAAVSRDLGTARGAAGVLPCGASRRDLTAGKVQSPRLTKTTIHGQAGSISKEVDVTRVHPRSKRRVDSRTNAPFFQRNVSRFSRPCYSATRVWFHCQTIKFSGQLSTGRISPAPSVETVNLPCRGL